MTDPILVPLEDYRELPDDEMRRRSAAMLAEMRRRRSIRDFSDRPVPRKVIEDCIRTAGTAPSGANMQPWHFAIVEDRAVKRRIREAAEDVEREFYRRRAPEAWLEAVAPLGTDAEKPFLELAPLLIVVFIQQHGLAPDGAVTKHYYPVESVGIATGMLIAAIHHAGLAALTYTPSPMRFLGEILDRPDNERPMMIIATGRPADDARVPRIGKKSLDQIATFV